MPAAEHPRGGTMQRIAHIVRLSVIATTLLITGCGPAPTPSTPTPTPTPQPTPSPTVASISITLSARTLHVGDVVRFQIRVDGADPVSSISVDFGDGATVDVGPTSTADVSHVYRNPGIYTVVVGA